MTRTTRGNARARALASAIVVAGAAAGAVVGPASAESPQTCAPMVILTARGSGESLAGGHGDTLTRLVNAVHKAKLNDGFDPSAIPARAIPYPAVPASEYTSKDMDLFDSIELGVVIGSSMAVQTLKTCPDTKFILTGYSQGVVVARYIAQALGPQKVAGVIGVGDPAQKGDMPNISGGGRHGDGLYRWLVRDKSDHADSDGFYDAGIRYQMWCHPQDWICNFFDEKGRPKDANNPAFTTYDHTYVVDPAEVAVIGAAGAVMARDATPKAERDKDGDGSADGTDTPAVTGAGTPIDLVFAIDTTSSMGPYIQQARNSAASITRRLQERSSAVRTAVVEYRDAGDDFRARVDLDLSDSQSNFQSALDGLETDGGGDTPESVFSGVMMALRVTWTPGAVRAVVVLGDAPAKDPEPGTGYTKSAVLAAMKDLAAVPKLPPTLGDESSLPLDPGTDGASAPSSLTPRTAAPARATVVAAALPVPASTDPSTDASTEGGTDTPTDPPSEGSGAAAADAGAVGANVSLFALTPDDELASDLTPVADGTGGKVTAVADDASDVSLALLRTMDLVANPLSAKLATPATVFAGHPFALNAAGSSAPAGTTFTFDADGNGTPDSTGLDPAQLVQVAKPGRYTAKVGVADVNGRRASASLEYTVRDAATRPTLRQPSLLASLWPPSTTQAVVVVLAVLALVGMFVAGWRSGGRLRAR